ncbi:hypothetical protein ACQEVZ_06595 [Dactylosporangium sp. CA-152071]|uniref:hypothetical protein n=1 Tax=Dactylosporangium sp. CA-152071 TaxID=3239933 RepID=UPI003D90C7E2
MRQVEAPLFADGLPGGRPQRRDRAGAADSRGRGDHPAVGVDDLHEGAVPGRRPDRGGEARPAGLADRGRHLDGPLIGGLVDVVEQDQPRRDDERDTAEDRRDGDDERGGERGAHPHAEPPPHPVPELRPARHTWQGNPVLLNPR